MAVRFPAIKRSTRELQTHELALSTLATRRYVASVASPTAAQDIQPIKRLPRRKKKPISAPQTSPVLDDSTVIDEGQISIIDLAPVIPPKRVTQRVVKPSVASSAFQEQIEIWLRRRGFSLNTKVCNCSRFISQIAWMNFYQWFRALYLFKAVGYSVLDVFFLPQIPK